jgi:hypothetical protein
MRVKECWRPSVDKLVQSYFPTATVKREGDKSLLFVEFQGGVFTKIAEGDTDYDAWEAAWEWIKTNVQRGLYAELVAAGIPIDNHASDLYFKNTPDSVAILSRYPDLNFTTFTHTHFNEQWFEVAFHYQPFWDRVHAESERRKALRDTDK